MIFHHFHVDFSSKELDSPKNLDMAAMACEVIAPYMKLGG